MSTLSKVFVILVLLVAVMKLGVDVALFAHRIDWKDKFVKEVNWDHQNQLIKNAEIQELGLQLENWKEYNNILNQKIELLGIEVASKSQQNAALQRQFDGVNANFQRLIADVDAYVRQLEVMNTQFSEMSQRVEDYRLKLAKAKSTESAAMTELMYLRQEFEVVQKSLSDLEANHIAQSRELKRHQETIKSLNDRGIPTDVAPSKPLEGKVKAVSPEVGLVVISIGKDDGVLEGNQFTVYRGGQFIAKITIDKVDRTWSAGHVTLKKEDPQLADDVSNSVFVSSFKQ